MYACTVSFDSYSPGDVLMVRPQNVKEAVEEFLRVMKIDGSVTFILKQNDPGTF